MNKINHIKMLEGFFKDLGEKTSKSIFLTGTGLLPSNDLKTEKKIFGDVKFSINCELFIRNCLPYKIEQLKNNKYIFVNREYKPLGVHGYTNSYEFINYEQFDFLAFEYKKADISNIYFYYDENRPQDNKKNFIEYLIRLKYFLINYENKEINTKSEDYYKITKIMFG